MHNFLTAYFVIIGIYCCINLLDHLDACSMHGRNPHYKENLEASLIILIWPLFLIFFIASLFCVALFMTL